ncbi:hypothetical protein NQZ68_007377 [Dissostichus eleginoides]|nr:hypothetical protein NQZ68_014944 [Dissostichus eleginoides]KAI9548519.1 hypothetical protein NQZ68_007377 [Dissostichus eleginoides]
MDTDHEERLLRGVSVAILTVIEDDDAAISPNVRDVAVVLEGTIVLHDLPDLYCLCIPLWHTLCNEHGLSKGDEVYL